ncbi:hypothetical protein C5167_012729 [Papaver somniferum]|uniref:ER membrane protein complex subunit 7 beta-sandwich domain-containing protein n=1 Tax=Papaver somniferum TaxID=3469 RepID=A0A4Y7J1Q7_PAPSO|nr:hypothetical protein C5167_012729 [Papaver somniferum]
MMMAMKRSKSIISVLLLLLLQFLAIASGNGEGYTIVGRVKVEGMGAKGYGILGKLSNAKVMLNGGQRTSFLRPDVCQLSKYFLTSYTYSHNVPAGTHLIEVASVGFFFSPVRVDVSARNPGKVQAALTETRRGLTELVLEPLKEEHYYEIREPFNVMSLLKSPMGLMMGFMVVVVFLMPKLMENMGKRPMLDSASLGQKLPSLSVDLCPRTSALAKFYNCLDPEELKRAQESVGNNPSLSSLLSRSG